MQVKAETMYRIFRFLSFPIWWAIIRIKNRKSLDVYNERMGKSTENRPNGEVIWVACEDAAAARPVVREICASMPNRKIVLTCPENSREIGRDVIFQRAPLDLMLTARKFLQFWEPLTAIWIGRGMKPNTLAVLKKMRIKSFLIEAGISDKSYRRWKWARRLSRRTMRDFAFIWGLNDFQTLRLANMGAMDIKSMSQMHGPDKLREILQEIRQKIRS
ncbi:MAG: hypothetical protein LBB08_02900 [Rickettsiales bacterium]|jgi:3-deoxy-D-manno-octulosonic-acid transferase|nr:hypothetical protein [Rickettsiales bacterium]